MQVRLLRGSGNSVAKCSLFRKVACHCSILQASALAKPKVLLPHQVMHERHSGNDLSRPSGFHAAKNSGYHFRAEDCECLSSGFLFTMTPCWAWRGGARTGAWSAEQVRMLQVSGPDRSFLVAEYCPEVRLMSIRRLMFCGMQSGRQQWE